MTNITAPGQRDYFVIRDIRLNLAANMDKTLKSFGRRLGRTPEEMKPVLKDFGKALSWFCLHIGDESSDFIKATGNHFDDVEVALRRLNAAAHAMRQLDGAQDAIARMMFERVAERGLGTSGASANRTQAILAITQKSVASAFELLKSFELTAGEVRNAKQILAPSDGGRPVDKNYKLLAHQSLAICRRHDIGVNRSTKDGGTLQIIEALISCFSLSVKLYERFDPDGNSYMEYAPPKRGRLVRQINQDTLFADLSGHLEIAIRPHVRKRTVEAARKRAAKLQLRF
jgi:hypothetical protein